MSRVIFLPVPESLHEQLKNTEDDFSDFTIDPNIPIPVEINEDSKTDIVENLSIETILSGMLRVIEAAEVRQDWIDYYSGFVLYLRPDILTKLKEIRNNDLADESYIKAHKLVQAGKAEEGLTHIRAFLELHPLAYNGWFILGWALRLLRRWEDGEAALRKAIELGGGGDTRNELAICLMEMGDNTGARRELETALKEDPQNIKIISNLGVLALKTGEKEKASAFFRTVLELDENDPLANKFFEK